MHGFSLYDSGLYEIFSDVNMVAEPKPHQIGRKRQNVTKTGNDWDYYYDRWVVSLLHTGRKSRTSAYYVPKSLAGFFSLFFSTIFNMNNSLKMLTKPASNIRNTEFPTRSLQDINCDQIFISENNSQIINATWHICSGNFFSIQKSHTSYSIVDRQRMQCRKHNRNSISRCQFVAFSD